jgi:hypothetical protein
LVAAVAYSGNTALRQTCTPDAAVAHRIVHNDRNMPSRKDKARPACVRRYEQQRDDQRSAMKNGAPGTTTGGSRRSPNDASTKAREQRAP